MLIAIHFSLTFDCCIKSSLQYHERCIESLWMCLHFSLL